VIEQWKNPRNGPDDAFQQSEIGIAVLASCHTHGFQLSVAKFDETLAACLIERMPTVIFGETKAETPTNLLPAEDAIHVKLSA
jgi:hypothetical protein